MLNVDPDYRDRVLNLFPDGALTRHDIARLSSAFESMAEEGQKVRGIVVHAKGFPGWASVGALWAHLRFVLMHHRRVDRIAIASDSLTLRLLPRLARLFLSPNVGIFGCDEFETASAWVRRD